MTAIWTHSGQLIQVKSIHGLPESWEFELRDSEDDETDKQKEELHRSVREWAVSVPAFPVLFPVYTTLLVLRWLWDYLLYLYNKIARVAFLSCKQMNPKRVSFTHFCLGMLVFKKLLYIENTDTLSVITVANIFPVCHLSLILCILAYRYSHSYWSFYVFPFLWGGSQVFILFFNTTSFFQNKSFILQ